MKCAKVINVIMPIHLISSISTWKMSSIPLLHRSSLSLLPPQCCNCNNFLAYILLLISTLLSTLYGSSNSVSKKTINNNKSCPNHQQHYNNCCSFKSKLKINIPSYRLGCVKHCVDKLVVCTGAVTKESNLIVNSNCQSSDTYILTPLKTTDQLSVYNDTRSNCWESNRKNRVSATTTDRRLLQQPQLEKQHRKREYCWFAKSDNKDYRISTNNNNRNSVNNDSNSPQGALLILSNTNIYTWRPSVTTTIKFKKSGVVAVVIIPNFVDLTHLFLHPTFTPHNIFKDSSFTSKHLLNNDKKPFSTSSAQRLFSSSLTPLLQDKQQSTHSNIKLDLSSTLHVFVQQRKSTSQSRKLQHLLVGVKKYA